jgi:hypothetical protein
MQHRSHLHIHDDDVRLELAGAREPVVSVLHNDRLKPHRKQAKRIHRQQALIIGHDQYDERAMQPAPPVDRGAIDKTTLLRPGVRELSARRRFAHQRLRRSKCPLTVL